MSPLISKRFVEAGGCIPKRVAFFTEGFSADSGSDNYSRTGLLRDEKMTRALEFYSAGGQTLRAVATSVNTRWLHCRRGCRYFVHFAVCENSDPQRSFNNTLRWIHAISNTMKANAIIGVIKREVVITMTVEQCKTRAAFYQCWKNVRCAAYGCQKFISPMLLSAENCRAEKPHL